MSFMSSIKELFSLEGKVAVVTGANGLIGKEHCRALHEAGANVAMCDINVEATQNTIEKTIGETAGDYTAYTMDVTSKESIESVAADLLKKYGKIDILINNAAINDMFENPTSALEQSKFENYPLDMWKRSLDVNVTGTFLCAQVFGTQMAKQGKGSIINVASTYGITAPNQSIYINDNGEQTFYKSAAYPATKGAVISFTRFLAAYWGNKGVRVNTLSPGGVENNQEEFFTVNYSKLTPLGRMAKADDYKGAVVFLASDASSYMTGANLVVDGGWTIW